ncbi:NAD(P)/FAD-dependent oxidoreductase [Sulfolobus tengchongensis]|uniref:NAD(P)/FAD-dependent oxidoreductase n=1 Tax=Sulfolobus tengchongensis TaxID=207809 RepID=A0AAX4KWW4_9CREN
MRAIIMGAGIGGLSLALLLAKKGFEVLVLEKLNQPGGRARWFKVGEFSFDMGPSWYLMPEIFNSFFHEAGESSYPITEVEPKVKIIKGKPLEREHESITFVSDLSNEDGPLEQYLLDTGYLYKVALNRFLYKELTLIDFLDRELILALKKFPILYTLDQFNRMYFKTDIMLKSMGFSSVFLGGSPYNIPAFYSIVNYAIFGKGVYYPKGGFAGYVTNLFELCRKTGVEFKFGFNISKIKINGNKVNCVGNDERCVEGDIFISNMDYHYTESVLPYDFRNVNYWSNKKVSPSAILAYIGAEGSINVPHHTVVINGEWRSHFDSIDNGMLPDLNNMSYYVSYRKATDDTLEGKDLVFLIPISPNENITHNQAINYVNFVIKDFKEKTNSNFEIKYLRVYTPADFKTDYNAYRGTAFGLAHTLTQTGPFRPPMQNKKLKNLYYVGQYTQPGIGVPMVTLSSMILYRKIVEE